MKTLLSVSVDNSLVIAQIVFGSATDFAESVSPVQIIAFIGRLALDDTSLLLLSPAPEISEIWSGFEHKFLSFHGIGRVIFHLSFELLHRNIRTSGCYLEIPRYAALKELLSWTGKWSPAAANELGSNPSRSMLSSAPIPVPADSGWYPSICIHTSSGE